VTGERYHESEINRIDAELLLTETGGVDEARADTRERADTLLNTAIACARRQEARTLELRAATVLARLGGRGVRGKQARTQLSELLAGFTEGLETADLQEARRLVEVLR
jgi:predicted ATPase